MADSPRARAEYRRVKGGIHKVEDPPKAVDIHKAADPV